MKLLKPLLPLLVLFQFAIADIKNAPMPRIMADVNGDGLADAVSFGVGGSNVALSSGSSFSSASQWIDNFGSDQGWYSDKHLLNMADTNGDGLADVVGFGNNGVSVALSNGYGFDSAQIWVNDFGYNQGWRLDSGLRIMADVNGDGKADIVGFGNNGVSVALSNGSEFTNAQRWVNDFGYNQGWRNDKGLRVMADVNGDNKADIVGFGNNGVSVALSNGNSFVNAQRWVDDFGYNQGWRNDKGLRFMSDVNGDGKDDIVGFGNNGVSVALSNGNSFVNAQRWVDDFGYNQGWRNNKGIRLMSDIDGDGKSDIVGFGNNGVSIAISNGSDFDNTSRWIDDFGYNKGWRNDLHLRLTADVDGDGSADIVGFGDSDIKVATSTGYNFSSASVWLEDSLSAPVGGEEDLEMVARNNEIRAEVYQDYRIVWSESLALSAQAHADKLAETDSFEHSDTPNGENLYASSADTKYVDAVNAWYSEKEDYDVETNTCAGGEVCGHYTQLIWQDTTEVGCGKSSGNTWNTIIVCHYNPPGNYIGESPF